MDSPFLNGCAGGEDCCLGWTAGFDGGDEGVEDVGAGPLRWCALAGVGADALIWAFGMGTELV